MGEKYIPRVIVWDEVCTVPQYILETFLEWLDGHGVQVVCCGDPGQPAPIAGGMLHDWLRARADYYEEVEGDYRAKDEEIKALKKQIRLKPNKFQHLEMCRVLGGSIRSCNRFIEAWKPGDLILASHINVCDWVQELLFQRHREHFQDTPVPLMYHPMDSRKQNVEVLVPGTENLVKNDVVDVSIAAAEAALGVKDSDWRLGYALTVHSCQGLIISEPQVVWIVNDYLA
ncbi:hypothetical protein BsWGS_27215 [Bradybaena similaris]